VDKKVADGGDNRSALTANLNDSSNLGQRRASQDGKDILDSLDWELDAGALDDSKTEEYLKKRKRVMDEKVWIRVAYSKCIVFPTFLCFHVSGGLQV